MVGKQLRCRGQLANPTAEMQRRQSGSKGRGPGFCSLGVFFLGRPLVGGQIEALAPGAVQLHRRDRTPYIRNSSKRGPLPYPPKPLILGSVGGPGRYRIANSVPPVLDCARRRNRNPVVWSILLASLWAIQYRTRLPRSPVAPQPTPEPSNPHRASYENVAKPTPTRSTRYPVSAEASTVPNPVSLISFNPLRSTQSILYAPFSKRSLTA